MKAEGFRNATAIELHDSRTLISVNPKATTWNTTPDIAWEEEGREIRYKIAGENYTEEVAYRITGLYARVESPQLLHLIMECERGDEQWTDELLHSGSFTIWWNRK